MARSFALRLAVAFAAVGVAAAMLTAVLVNVAFDRRFDSYLGERSRLAQQELGVALADSYRRNDGWEPASLRPVGGAALMNGLAISVEDATGRSVWSSDAADDGMAAMHREMMGIGPLGPPRRFPIGSGGRERGDRRGTRAPGRPQPR